MYETYHSGWIECITGSMFSGKIRRTNKTSKKGIYAKQKSLYLNRRLMIDIIKKKWSLIMVMPLKRLIFLKQVKL